MIATNPQKLKTDVQNGETIKLLSDFYIAYRTLERGKEVFKDYFANERENLLKHLYAELQSIDQKLINHLKS